METYYLNIALCALALTMLFIYLLFFGLVLKRRKQRFLDKYVRLTLLVLGLSILMEQGDLVAPVFAEQIE